MPKIILFVLIICFTITARAQTDSKSICRQINELNTQILNGTLKRADAARKFKPLIEQLKVSGGGQSTSWTFPLQGYGAKSIGGYKGNGYTDKGYNYLDGNKHTAHPAHDIFINDRNQDNLDDRSLKPVNVLAVSPGIVIACSNTWEPGSALRGGKYIWVYHPRLNIISYYAHNQVIFVTPGDEVTQGQKIAEVGRSGLNAYKKRSPTHLHFSAFKLVNDLPVPFNPYQQLVEAKKI